MSNFLILCSDKPFGETKLKLEKLLLDKVVYQNLNLTDLHSYALYPVANIEKTRESEKSAPEFYKATCEFFKDLYELYLNQLKKTDNAFLIQTFYGQNFKNSYLERQGLPIEKLMEPYISFEFNTIYQLLL